MDLRRLSFFLALVDSENFSTAADKCAVSKSTLSQGIAKLEKELDVSLVVRSRGGFRLTPEGRGLVEPARQLLRDAKKLVGEVKNKGTESIVVGVSSMADIPVLRRLVDGFKEHIEEPPRFQFVQENYSRLKEAVRSGRVDFGFCSKRSGAAVSKGLEVVAVARSMFYAIVGENSPLAQAKCLTVRDLEPYLLLPLSGTQQQHMQAYSSMADFNLRTDVPCKHILGASLRAYEGEVIVVDLMPWESDHLGVVSVPIKLTDSAADRYLDPLAILYRCSADLQPLDEGSMAQKFWDYACEHALSD